MGTSSRRPKEMIGARSRPLGSRTAAYAEQPRCMLDTDGRRQLSWIRQLPDETGPSSTRAGPFRP